MAGNRGERRPDAAGWGSRGEQESRKCGPSASDPATNILRKDVRRNRTALAMAAVSDSLREGHDGALVQAAVFETGRLCLTTPPHPDYVSAAPLIRPPRLPLSYVWVR
jgi:hypothetical protein